MEEITYRSESEPLPQEIRESHLPSTSGSDLSTSLGKKISVLSTSLGKNISKTPSTDVSYQSQEGNNYLKKILEKIEKLDDRISNLESLISEKLQCQCQQFKISD